MAVAVPTEAAVADGGGRRAVACILLAVRPAAPRGAAGAAWTP